MQIRKEVGYGSRRQDAITPFHMTRSPTVVTALSQAAQAFDFLHDGIAIRQLLRPIAISGPPGRHYAGLAGG